MTSDRRGFGARLNASMGLSRNTMDVSDERNSTHPNAEGAIFFCSYFDKYRSDCDDVGTVEKLPDFDLKKYIGPGGGRVDPPTYPPTERLD